MARKKRYISKPPINNRMTSPPATTTTQLNTDPLNNTAQRQHDCSQTLPEQAFPPISSKVMFWRPRYLAQSQWLQHVPFYFWLTEVLEPKLVVDPCVNSAVGYFAICQAIDKLNQDGVIHGALGAQCDSEQVLAYNHEHYREFSNLVTEDEATFLAGFADHSIDILVLKHDSTLLASEAGLATVQQRVSNNGVVLIHGSTLPTLRDQSQHWRSRYLSFELTLASGLLLLCMGQQVPSRLQALINQSREPSGKRVIHNIYARLGAASEDNWYRVAQQRQLQQWQRQQQQDAAALNAITAERDNLLAANGQLNAQLKQQETEYKQREQALQQDLQTRFDELATLTQLLVTAEAAGERQHQANQEAAATITALTAERDSLQASNRQLKEHQKQAEQQLQKLSAELTRVTEQCAMLERDQEVAAERIATLTQSELALQQALAERFDELATLTNLLLETEQEQQRKLADQQPAHSDPLVEAHFQTQTEQDSCGIGARLKATLGAVKPRKGQAQLAQKAALIRASELFDEAWYLQQHPEAASHRFGAAGHYLEVGAAKGANPSPQFDGNTYLQANPDVKAAGMNPLYHYIKFGHDEMRLLKVI